MEKFLLAVGGDEAILGGPGIDRVVNSRPEALGKDVLATGVAHRQREVPILAVRREERGQGLGVIVERDLVVALVCIEDGVPAFSTWESSDLFPRSPFWIGGPDAELIQTPEVDAEADLAGTLLGNDDDGVKPVVCFRRLLDRFEDAGLNLLINLILQRLHVGLSNTTVSAGR